MNKKIFIALTLLCSFAVTKVNAQHIVKSTFYGSKASSTTANPCKGKCKTKCGEVVETYYAVSDTETFVETTVKDNEGNILNNDSYLINSSINDLLIQDKKKYDAYFDIDSDIFSEDIIP